MTPKYDHDPDVVTESETRSELKRPSLYKVLLHNDNYTTMEFVVSVLREVFRKSEAESIQIMLQVHHQGVGVAGVYTYDVAETKIRTTEALARQQEYPLRLSMEPEEV